MKSKTRNRIIWSTICSVGVICGLIDFYLTWIKNIKVSDLLPSHIYSIIGIIGFVSLCALWVYWNVTDFITFQKNEISDLKAVNSRLISAINNHADCLDTKTMLLTKPSKDNSVFKEIVNSIDAFRFDNPIL